MAIVHLKTNENHDFDVIELGEDDNICPNCLRLALEDHNELNRNGQVAVNAINKAIGTFNQIADLVKAEPKFSRSEVVGLLTELKHDLTAPPHMQVPDIRDTLTSLFDMVFDRKD